MQSTGARPQTQDDFQLVPYYEAHQRVCALRDQRLAQVGAASAAASAMTAASWRSSSRGPLAPQPKARATGGTEVGLRPLPSRGLKDPEPILAPEECDHPRVRAVARANQHASWTKCLQCGGRLSYMSKKLKPKFAGFVQIPPKAPEEVLVVETKNDVERMIIDSGCKRSVAGRRWHRRMHALLQAQGLKPQRRNIDEVFRFGDGTLVNLSVAFVYPIGVFGTHGTVDVAMVRECPPLLSNKALKEPGVSMDWSEETMTVRAARAYDRPMERLPSEHPSMVVTDFDETVKFPDEFLCWGSEPDDVDATEEAAEPAFTAFTDGVCRQVPKGVKKRLSRITSSLRDVFSVSVGEVLSSCRRRWLGTGASLEPSSHGCCAVDDASCGRHYEPCALQPYCIRDFL